MSAVKWLIRMSISVVMLLPAVLAWAFDKEGQRSFRRHWRDMCEL